MKSAKLSTNSSKKSTKAQIDERAAIVADLSFSDPLSSVVTFFDKRIRSLEKRKIKSFTLRQESVGKQLNEDQLATASKYEEINLKLEFTKEIHEIMEYMHTEYLKKNLTNSSSKLDPITEAKHEAVADFIIVTDVLSNSHMYMQRLNIINSSGDKDPISRSDINSIVKFKRLIDSNQKKYTYHYQNLVSRSEKLINKDINTSYNDLISLIIKIHKKIQFSTVSSNEDSNTKNTLSNSEINTQSKTVESKSGGTDQYVLKTNNVEAEIVEIVEKTEDMNVWHDCNRSNNERKNAKDRKVAIQSSSITNKNYRGSGLSNSKPRSNNYSAETNRITSDGTQIIVRDIKRPGFDNQRGSGDRSRDRNYESSDKGIEDASSSRYRRSVGSQRDRQVDSAGYGRRSNNAPSDRVSIKSGQPMAT